MTSNGIFTQASKGICKFPQISEYSQKFLVILNIPYWCSTLMFSSRIAWNDQQWNLHTTVLAKKSWVSLQIPRKLPRSPLHYSIGILEHLFQLILDIHYGPNAMNLAPNLSHVGCWDVNIPRGLIKQMDMLCLPIS